MWNEFNPYNNNYISTGFDGNNCLSPFAKEIPYSGFLVGMRDINGGIVRWLFLNQTSFNQPSGKIMLSNQFSADKSKRYIHPTAKEFHDTLKGSCK